MNTEQRVTQGFGTRFGVGPTYLVRAPGRVNLIGEHTDYNEGFVMPLAIDRAIRLALRPRADGQVIVHSLDFAQTVSFEFGSLTHGSVEWAEYIKGVAWALQEKGYALGGWEGVMAGDAPIGAGLSSSAALELAAARGFAIVSGWTWQPAAMAKICQQAENQWVGVNCGIMDQMISAAGRAGHALLIDCRSLEFTPVPLPSGTAVVVMDTATRRGLVGSAYNERRTQCEASARFFGVAALRDVSPAQFNQQASGLPEPARRRARHVVSENARTLAAAEAMQRGDAVALGQLLSASHQSLRDDFEVSSRELDVMVMCAERELTCYGARMTGAGFGGCAVALVQADSAGQFAAAVTADYQRATGLQPSLYICQAMDGADTIAMPPTHDA